MYYAEEPDRHGLTLERNSTASKANRLAAIGRMREPPGAARLHARGRQARSSDFNDQRQPAADSGRGRPKQRIYAFHIDQSPRDKIIAHDRKVAVADAAVDSPAKIATSALPDCAGAEAL
jgi:hypothetical protein